MKRKLFVLFVIVLALCGLSLAVYVNTQPEEPVTYYNYTVSAGEQELSITADGYLKSKSEAKISAQISAEVKEVKVKIGSKVNKGDILAILDDTELQRKVREDKASYNSAIENKKSIQAGPDKDNKSSVRQAQFQINAAKERLDKAQADLEKAKIRAAITGEVVNISVVAGQITSLLDTAFVVSDTANLEAELQISEDDIFSIFIDQEAKIELNSDGRIFTGKVTSIRGTAISKNNTRYFPVIVSSAEFSGLKSDMSVSAELDQLALPAEIKK